LRPDIRHWLVFERLPHPTAFIIPQEAKMTIAILCQNIWLFVPHASAGGCEKILWRILKNLISSLS
jgi:hypothetical protein